MAFETGSTSFEVALKPMRFILVPPLDPTSPLRTDNDQIDQPDCSPDSYYIIYFLRSRYRRAAPGRDISGSSLTVKRVDLSTVVKRTDGNAVHCRQWRGREAYQNLLHYRSVNCEGL